MELISLAELIMDFLAVIMVELHGLMEEYLMIIPVQGEISK